MSGEPSEDDPEIEPMIHALCAQIGHTLILIQSVERMLRTVMTIVIPKQGAMTVERLQSQEKVEADKTIGYFLSQLRFRVDVHPKLDERLKSFHANRNILVHDMRGIVGGGIETREQINASVRFALSLSEDAYFILRVFAGLLFEWGEEAGLKVSMECADEIVSPDFRKLAKLSFAEKGLKPEFW